MMLASLALPALLLAKKTPPPKQMSGEVFVWLGLLVGLAFLLGILALWIKRKLLTEDEPQPLGFSLKDLRTLHAQGQLSDEELARAEEKARLRQKAQYLGTGTGTEGEDEVEDIGDITTQTAEAAGEAEEAGAVDPRSIESDPDAAGPDGQAKNDEDDQGDAKNGPPGGKPENPR